MTNVFLKVVFFSTQIKPLYIETGLFHISNYNVNLANSKTFSLLLPVNIVMIATN